MINKSEYIFQRYKSYDNDRVFHELMKKKTGSEKIKMGFSMFQFASHFVISSINKKLKRNTSESEFRKTLFLRIYGKDFSSQELEEIIKVINY